MEILSSFIKLESFPCKLIYMLGTAMIWYSLFALVIDGVPLPKFNKKSAANIKQKIVALLYDSIVLLGPAYIYLNRGINVELQDPWLDKIILYQSCGYYMGHLAIVLKYQITTRGQILHHLLTILAIIGGAIVDYAAQIGCLWLFIYQLSHLPLHARAILKDFGRVYTKVYEYAESAYFGIYLFERLFAGTWLLYQIFFELEYRYLYVPALASLTYLQSLYFCFQICKLLPRKLKKYRERKRKGIEYFWIDDNPLICNLSYYRNQEVEKIL